MGNIKNFNFNKLDLKLSNSEFWDFYLATDEGPSTNFNGLSTGDCFVVWYDFNNLNIYENSATTANTIHSLVSWNNAINTGYTFNSFGLTGIDNGKITVVLDPNDTTNQVLASALTGTTLVISSGQTELVLSKVTGFTGNYIYPVDIIPNSSVGSYAKLCGGFYQGFYKIDGSTYEVLPNRVNSAWSAEFWLMPDNDCSYTGVTLNDVYPNNSGFFFYLGTRAENKFWNQFYGNNTGCTSACTISSGCTDIPTQFCTIPKENNVTLISDHGFGIPLIPPRVEIDLVTNKFLIYGRAYDARPNLLTGTTNSVILSAINNSSNFEIDCGCGATNLYGPLINTNNKCNLVSTDGLGAQTVCTYSGGGIYVAKTKEIINDFRNPFLIYGRSIGNLCSCKACTDGFGSETVCTYSGKTIQESSIDYNLDIIDNALGFRIRDDGSIGYRLLTMTGDCYTASTGERFYSSGITINEKYSEPNIVSADTWSYIVIRFVTDYKDDCDLKIIRHRVGRLMIYINGKLKFIDDNFPEFFGKRLNDYYGKQIGVPYNISIGGGTQGLIESMTFDGQDINDLQLPIERNFAGSFIGNISQFKFNICDLNYENILYNYNSDVNRYLSSSGYIITENNNLLLQENNYGLIL